MADEYPMDSESTNMPRITICVNIAQPETGTEFELSHKVLNVRRFLWMFVYPAFQKCKLLDLCYSVPNAQPSSSLLSVASIIVFLMLPVPEPYA